MSKTIKKTKLKVLIFFSLLLLPIHMMSVLESSSEISEKVLGFVIGYGMSILFLFNLIGWMSKTEMICAGLVNQDEGGYLRTMIAIVSLIGIITITTVSIR